MKTLAKTLLNLKNKGSVPFSSVSAKNKKLLARYFEAGILDWETFGAGRRVVVKNPEALEKNIKISFPQGLEKATDDITNRTEATAVYRNSKEGSRGFGYSVVLSRAFSTKATLTLNGKILPVGKWCKQAGNIGCTAIRIKDGDHLIPNGNLGTVENKEVFWRFEELNLDTDIVIWTEGRFAQRVIDSLQVSKHKMTHLGDYDPVGVAEYLRIKKKISHTKMYIPDNLEYLFKKFGLKKLLEDSSDLYVQLRSSRDVQAKTIVGLMSQYCAGLEHESLLIRE